VQDSNSRIEPLINYSILLMLPHGCLLFSGLDSTINVRMIFSITCDWALRQGWVLLNRSNDSANYNTSGLQFSTASYSVAGLNNLVRIESTFKF